MKEKVAANEHPWIDGWNALIRDRKAQADYEPLPQRHMISRQRAQEDAAAAYLNALRWQISGEQSASKTASKPQRKWGRG